MELTQPFQLEYSSHQTKDFEMKYEESVQRLKKFLTPHDFDDEEEKETEPVEQTVQEQTTTEITEQVKVPPRRERVTLEPTCSQIYTYDGGTSILTYDSIDFYPLDGGIIHVCSKHVTSKSMYKRILLCDYRS
jgi:hypothetical protein